MRSLQRIGSLEAALTSLRADTGAAEVHLRLEVDQGARLEGRLLGISDEEVRLMIDDDETAVPISEINAIYVSRPRPLRHLLLAGTMIVGGTGALVLYSAMPWVAIDTTDWTEVFGGIFVIGILIARQLARSERFVRWWTQWVPLFVR